MLSGWFEPSHVPFVVLACVVAALVAWAATPLCRRFASLIGAIDIPQDDRRIHKTPMPRLGGLAIFLGFVAAMLLFAEINTQLRGILIGAVIIIVLGCVDDVVRLHYSIKLVFQCIAALVVALHGLTIGVFSSPLLVGPAHFDLGVLSIPITILWIMAITNAVNLIDGLDGLACGVSLIGSLSLLVIALALKRPDVALIMAALSGGCLGFLPYNFNPAKLFMGDTGATFLGFILAVASIQGLFKVYTIISFAVPFLILGLPLFDTILAVLRRLLTKHNPAHADRQHIHHRLIDMGFSQKQAVAILYAIAAVMGITAVVLTTLGEIRAIAVLLVMIAIVAVVYVILANRISTRNGISAAEGKTGPPAPLETELAPELEKTQTEDGNHA